MTNSRREITGKFEKLDNESKETAENLKQRTLDLENVKILADTLKRDAGTAEGIANVIQNVINAKDIGSDKFDEVDDTLNSKTVEIDENSNEIKEDAENVNENVNAINEIENSIDDSDLSDEVDSAKKSAIDDHDFLEESFNKLDGLAEQTKDIANDLKRRAEQARQKGFN